MSNSTRTDAELKARVDELMQRPYRMEIRWDEDYWAVEFPQLPGLVAGAEDWSSLAATVDDAKRAYFEAALEHGDELPEPEDTPSSDVSGKVLLRLPKSLHRQAIREATRDGVSINTWLLTAIAKELGRNQPPVQPRRRAAVAKRVRRDPRTGQFHD
jgi:antitoxin HicB